MARRRGRKLRVDSGQTVFLEAIHRHHLHGDDRAPQFPRRARFTSTCLAALAFALCGNHGGAFPDQLDRGLCSEAIFQDNCLRKRSTACQRLPHRLSRTPVAENCLVLEGDCNSLIDDVLCEIPQRSLTLAFIDPKGLDIRFDTVAKLSKTRRADLVILFADAYDISRNDEAYYRDNPNSKLDEVLGPDSDWRARLDALSSHSSINKREPLREDLQRSTAETSRLQGI